MEEFEYKILYVSEILKEKEYRKHFKNEVRILDSFIMNNNRLFRLDESGKLFIRKKDLDNALNPIKAVKSTIPTGENNDL